MSWRDRLSTLFFSTPIPEDPDEHVEIGVVPIAQGPILVTQLCEAGFDAAGHDSFDRLTRMANRYRILVPRRQADEATHHLEELLKA
jgi:hypothetical protein